MLSNDDLLSYIS